jgi:hypothetical protein
VRSAGTLSYTARCPDSCATGYGALTPMRFEVFGNSCCNLSYANPSNIYTQIYTQTSFFQRVGDQI